MGRVEGKVALITGAASGLGLEDARVLAREGVAICTPCQMIGNNRSWSVRH